MSVRDDVALTEGSGEWGGEKRGELNKIKETESAGLVECGLAIRGESSKHAEIFLSRAAYSICDALTEIMNTGRVE